MPMLIKFFYFSLLWSSVHHKTLPADTIIKKIRIQFEYSSSIFPESWQEPPVNAWGDTISASEITRSKTIMIKALNKYPDAVLTENLNTVYFLKKMKYFGVPYGGTNSYNAVYIANDGTGSGYSDLYIEQTFHHEFSSILFRKYAAFLNTDDWKSANLSGFDYNDPENGVGSIRKNESSQDIDTFFCKQGFLTQYALSSMENDINTIAQNLFSPSQGFWRIVNDYPLIEKKVKLLIAFYNKISPLFTEVYFRNFRFYAYPK